MLDDGCGVTALCADTWHEKRKTGRCSPNLGEFGRVGGSDDQTTIAELGPLVRDAFGNVHVDRFAAVLGAVTNDWKSSPPGLLVRHRAMTPPPSFRLCVKNGSTESVPRYGLTVTACAPYRPKASRA